MYGNGAAQGYAPTTAQDVSSAKIVGNAPDTRLLPSAIADIDRMTDRVFRAVDLLEGVTTALFGANPPSADVAEGIGPRPTAHADELAYVLNTLNRAVYRLESVTSVFQKL